MNRVNLEEQFKLTRGFWLAYALLVVPVITFARPWAWQLPLISQIAAYMLLPFAAAIVTYCSIAFAAALARGSSKEKKIGIAFLTAIGVSALFLAAVWWLHDFGRVPSLFGAAAVIIANLTFAFLRTKNA